MGSDMNAISLTNSKVSFMGLDLYSNKFMLRISRQKTIGKKWHIISLSFILRHLVTKLPSPPQLTSEMTSNLKKQAKSTKQILLLAISMNLQSLRVLKNPTEIKTYQFYAKQNSNNNSRLEMWKLLKLSKEKTKLIQIDMKSW